jgi:RNA polymerase sigma-70 factor, ECF subfamily
MGSDAELVRRCRQGRPEAWRELVRCFTPLAYRLALGMLARRAEAEDAVQEAFIRVHQSFDGFDATMPLAPWVARITYHVCLRRLERVRAAGESTDPQALEGVQDERARCPEAHAAQGQAEGLLGAVLDRLSSQDRALLTLRYRDGLSDSEVAEVTGMPINTVKTRIFRARGRMREWLAPLLEGTL